MGLMNDNYPDPHKYPPWMVEDILDMVEDMELESGLTPEEMRTTAKEYYNRARWLYEEVNSLEYKAALLERIARDEEEFGVKWIDKNLCNSR